MVGTIKTRRIFWKQGKYGTWRGSANGVELFSIHASTRKDDHSVQLRSELPYGRRDTQHANNSDAQLAAEVALREFLTAIGARL